MSCGKHKKAQKREMVFLAFFDCFPYVCQLIKLVIFETNQIHVGGVLAGGKEINKRSFEIFVCILSYDFSRAIWNK